MASADSGGDSIVEWFSEHEGYKCGYCKSPNTNFSHGMWAHSMTAQDYQDLIDRGWRRSGKYVYKPTLDRTCCPMYPIRCAALELRLTKSQRQIIKRVNRFINHGIRPSHTSESGEEEGDKEVGEPEKTSAGLTGHKRLPAPGIGADPTKPHCVKAKLIRKCKREEKMAAVKSVHSPGVTSSASSSAVTSVSCAGDSKKSSNNLKAKSKADGGKSLEELLNDRVTSPVHRLEIKLVESEPMSSDMKRTLTVSHSVYVSYQTAVHHDQPHEVNMKQFSRFLVDSPLIRSATSGDISFGSYHQQYWLDGVLIAVGVLDVLPHCVSSVYLYYDPQYSFLSLGTYSALQELALTRLLQRTTYPDLLYYYMGFYIHSCPKMRYKGQYNPSSLCCPETYQWFSISHCVPLLEVNKYSRFNPSQDAVDSEAKLDTDRILCLYNRTVMEFSQYLTLKRAQASTKPQAGKTKERGKPNTEWREKEELESVALYGRLVGSKCAYRMLLYRA